MEDRLWWVFNVSITLVIVLFLLFLGGVELPTLGQAVDTFDTTAPLCVVQYKGEHHVWEDLDRCCLEARKQVSCDSQVTTFPEGKVDYLCQTGESVAYALNTKAYSYCTHLPIWGDT